MVLKYGDLWQEQKWVDPTRQNSPVVSCPFRPFQLEMEKRREHQFEEIKGIANSPDFYMFTKEEFNKTWTKFEDETTGEIALNRVRTPTSSLPTTWKQDGFPRQMTISNNNMKSSQGGPSFRYKLYCIT